MISILRKIRRSFIDSGSIRKYFFYALGEIILVVIGILIALEINNWSAEKKEREMEVKILREIDQNLNLDLNDHYQNMTYVDGIIRSSKIVLNHLNNDLPFHDSLKVHFGWLPMAANFDAVISGYELMISEGVDIIQNDSLRNDISYLYNNQYSWLRSWLKDRQYTDRPVVLDQMILNFEVIRPFDYAVPSDFESLKSNSSFKAAVSHYSYSFELTARFYAPIIQNVEKLRVDIKKEIDLNR